MNTPCDSKKRIILENEERFAAFLATSVLDKPKISVWMILIPILFVYYIYRHQKFTVGREMFASHYMTTRKQVLDEACEAADHHREPDASEVTQQAHLSESVAVAFNEWVGLLLGHYTILLNARGDSYEALVQSAYKNRMNYLMFVNQLNKAEDTLNQALAPTIEASSEGVSTIVSAMARISETSRRDQAQKIFP